MKRALSELFDEGCGSPKRLRGGGAYDGDGDDDPSSQNLAEEELFDGDIDIVVHHEPFEEIPEEALEEVKAKIPEKDQQRWKRPDVPSSFNNEVDLNIQWIDMDVVVAPKPLEKNPNPARSEVVGVKEGQVPVLRCYGVNEEGHSVAAFLHGFTPYAFFALPAGSPVLDDQKDAAALAEIRSCIDTRLREGARNAVSQQTASNASIPLVLGVNAVHGHQSIYGYETPHTQFLKVYVTLPSLLAPLKRVMEEGIILPPISDQRSESYSPFECNVPFVLRFMVDRGISGAGWLSFPATTYTIRPSSYKETHCQVCLFADQSV